MVWDAEEEDETAAGHWHQYDDSGRSDTRALNRYLHCRRRHARREGGAKQ